MRNKSRNLILVFVIIFIVIPLILYFIHFGSMKLGFSDDNSDWGAFGSYLSGAIGGLLSSFSFFLLYFSFENQRKDNSIRRVDEIINNYHKMIESINENWLHQKDKEYLKGREIFGRAVEKINVHNDEDAQKSFNLIFEYHINVFQHYSNYIITSIEELMKIEHEYKSEKPIRRFLMQMSFFEKIWILYFLNYLPNHEELKKVFVEYIDFEDRLGQTPHSKKVTWIKESVKNWC